MNGFPILSALLALPMLGALACLLTSAKGARWIALVTTLATLALSVGLWATYQIGGAQWQFVEYVPLFGRFAWALGIDGETGTLEPGKKADVVVWSADPFSVYARAEKVFNEGWLVYDRTDPARQPRTDFHLGQGTPGVGR